MEIRVANTFWKRLKGLIGKSVLGEDQGLFFPRCSQVHTWGMRFPIDVVWIDRTGKIEEIESLAPWKVSRYHKNAYGCIEVVSGGAAKQSWRVGSIIPDRVCSVDKEVDVLPGV